MDHIDPPESFAPWGRILRLTEVQRPSIFQWALREHGHRRLSQGNLGTLSMAQSDS